MRLVPIAEFKDRVSEYVNAAGAGDAITITRHGKPIVTLNAIVDDRRAIHAAAIAGLAAIGRNVFARDGATATADIRNWIEEDRP